MLADAALTLEIAAEVVRAEIGGVSLPEHKPLQELHRAGKLDEVMRLLETLSRNPEYTEAALELATGSGMGIVAKCLPQGARHG